MMNDVDGMKQSKDCVMHNRKSCDFEREREEDEGARAMVMRLTRRLNRDQVMGISRLSGGESLVCVRENLIFDAFVDF